MEKGSSGLMELKGEVSVKKWSSSKLELVDLQVGQETAGTMYSVLAELWIVNCS